MTVCVCLGSKFAFYNQLSVPASVGSLMLFQNLEHPGAMTE